MRGLPPRREPQNAPVQADGGKGEKSVGEGMLAEERAVSGVHQQPDEPRDADPHLARLVHAPERKHERDHVGQPDDVAPGQQVEKQCEHHGERHVTRLRGRQDALLLFVERH